MTQVERYQVTPEIAARMGDEQRTINLEIASDHLYLEHLNLHNHGHEPDPRTVEAHRLLREVIEERRAWVKAQRKGSTV